MTDTIRVTALQKKLASKEEKPEYHFDAAYSFMRQSCPHATMEQCKAGAMKIAKHLAEVWRTWNRAHQPIGDGR